MQDKDIKAIQQYIESRRKYGYSDEELFEMRASFGEDEEVVDIFTGQKINLRPSRPNDVTGKSLQEKD